MPRTPPIPKPVRRLPSGRIPRAAIRKYVRQLVEKFRPEKVILFGSHAYGKPDEGSDVDLLHERGHSVPKSHDCEALLLPMVLHDPALGRLQRAAAGLSHFAVDPRYPGYQPTPSESRSAWNAAEHIRAEVRRRLGLRPRP